MRRLSWLIAGVLIVVVGVELTERRVDPATRKVRAALEELPLTEAEREQILDAYRHRELQPPAPQDVTETVVGHARRYQMPSGGRLTLRVNWGEGAWYLYDRNRLEDFQEGEPWLRSLDDALERPGRVGVAAGVTTVSWCEDGDAPLDLRLRRRAPDRLRTGADAVTDFDLDLPTGDAVIEGNGDGAAQAVVAIPAGRYRARMSLAGSDDCAKQRFALDLWPRRGSSELQVLRAWRAATSSAR